MTRIDVIGGAMLLLSVAGLFWAWGTILLAVMPA